MILGVPREVKSEEYRVSVTPAGCEALVADGHTVLVETGAGAGSGSADDLYVHSGAEIAATAEEVFARAEMIVKVKEPQPGELSMMRRGQIMFTFFHFAADPALAEAVAATGATAVAYETIADKHGRLPLLTPMSEVAGRMSAQVGACCLQRSAGGRGILMGAVSGTPPADVLILGGGVVGTQAAKVAAGMGADVTILDIDLDRLRYLADVMPANVRLLMSNAMTVRQLLPGADMLIGAVLVPGARTPVLLSRQELRRMPPDSVFVDVCVDQGGCAETTRPTTHKAPTYVQEGVLHYCVANIPGVVPRTSTAALSNATLPYARWLAGVGWREAAKADAGLALGVTMVDGAVTNRAVAEACGMPLEPLRL